MNICKRKGGSKNWEGALMFFFFSPPCHMAKCAKEEEEKKLHLRGMEKEGGGRGGSKIGKME